MSSWVYKLHFWPPYKHAAHYSGRSDKPPERLADHALGRGARLTQVQLQAGGSWVIGLLEPGNAERERQIKGHEAGRYCNVCQALEGYRSGESTLEQALGRAGWDRASEHERGLLAEIFGIDPAGIDTGKIPYTAPKPITPQPEPEPFEFTPEIDAIVDELVVGWTASKGDVQATAERWQEATPQPEPQAQPDVRWPEATSRQPEPQAQPDVRWPEATSRQPEPQLQPEPEIYPELDAELEPG